MLGAFVPHTNAKSPSNGAASSNADNNQKIIFTLRRKNYKSGPYRAITCRERQKRLQPFAVHRPKSYQRRRHGFEFATADMRTGRVQRRTS